MRVLVTGAFGFVGRYLIAELRQHGHDIFAYDVGPVPPDLRDVEAASGDVRDAASLRNAIRRAAPDACVHLAALAFVPAGAEDPQAMIDVNILGTIRLLESFRREAPKARVLVVSTAQVYGRIPRPAPLREEDPLAPDSIYAISKAAADDVARLYARQYGMDILVARPYNHIGPGQSPLYVVSSFARQVRAIAAGAPNEIKVGNLDSRRDFTDVRDVARAYRLLLERGRTGEAYNLGSGTQVRIGDILDRLCAQAGVRPRITRDPALYRPDHESPPLDIRKVRDATGWIPGIPLDQTLRDILASPAPSGA